jgi:hypothetical protein
MPNLDKTGPKGEGPLTGRKKGNCVDENTCCNGTRKKCCQTVNNDFYQNRMKRNNQD